VIVYSIRVSRGRIRLFLTADVSQQEIRHGLKLFLASGDRRLNRQMLKVVPGPQTRVIDTSFTIRVSGWKTKTNEGCAVGRRKGHSKVVGRRSEKAETKEQTRRRRCDGEDARSLQSRGL
jgi:hypothetical protein